MTGARVGLLAVVVWGIGACHALTMADAERSSETATARQLLDALERGDADAVMARMSADGQTLEMKERIRKLIASLPAGPPAQIRLYGWNVHVVEADTETTETAQLSFEATYPQGSYLLETDFDGPRLALDLTNLHVSRLPAPLAVMNAFTLRGRSTKHYVFLLVMASALGTTVSALIRWFRIRTALRHRWWWLLAILALPISVSLNWTTADITYRAITFSIGLVLGIVRRGDGGPWIFTVSIPIGAIVFLVLRRRTNGAALPARDAPLS